MEVKDGNIYQINQQMFVMDIGRDRTYEKLSSVFCSRQSACIIGIHIGVSCQPTAQS